MAPLQALAAQWVLMLIAIRSLVVHWMLVVAAAALHCFAVDWMGMVVMVAV